MNTYTYDLAKLHAQVNDVVPREAAFCVEINVWDHRHAKGDVSVEITISVCPRGGSVMQFRAPTPDAALVALRSRYDAMEMQPADLGLIAVPESEDAISSTASSRNVRVVEYGGSPMEMEG
ncbi:MAG TPA: hypothetical protein DCQ64_00430 [Candidatus Rokubacteria bacterium]|nr:hypothetical protein [Candidatus Rokubacteria bacterium]